MAVSKRDFLQVLAAASVAGMALARFGHAGLLDEMQMRHLMSLLLDPKSPVNQ